MENTAVVEASKRAIQRPQKNGMRTGEAVSTVSQLSTKIPSELLKLLVSLYSLVSYAAAEPRRRFRFGIARGVGRLSAGSSGRRL